MHPTLRAALLASIALSFPVAGHATDVTPDQAAKLQGQLRDWFQGMAGPGLPVSASPVQVTAEGDHFRLTMPPAGFKMPVQGIPPVMADAKPLDGGRWALDNIHIQTPATFTVDTPVPAGSDTPKPPARPGAATPPRTAPGGKATESIPTTYTLTYAKQDGSGTWDPSFATPSVINSNSTGFQLVSENRVAKQVTKIERTNSTTTLKPAADGRVDAMLDADADGYSMTTSSASGAGGGAPAIQSSAGHAKVGFNLLGVSRDQVARIVPALVKFAPAPGAVPGADGKKRANPEGVRLLVEALQGFASSGALTEDLSDFKVSGPGFSFASSQLRFNMDVKAAGGMMAGAMEIGLDGMSLPGMGLDAFANLLPKHVALRPVVSQVPTKELLQLFETAMLGQDGGPPPEQVAALFSHGGLKGGLESFTVDMGGASFTGTANVDIPNPNTASGTAKVTATNLDALMTEVQANPALAQAVPAIALMKGMGHADGNKVVWDLAFSNGKLLVNGVDMSKMGGR